MTKNLTKRIEEKKKICMLLTRAPESTKEDKEALRLLMNTGIPFVYGGQHGNFLWITYTHLV